MKQLMLLTLVVMLPKPSPVFALALSDVELQSHLNQRLSARIMLTDVQAEEISELNIGVKEIADENSAARQVVLKHEVVAEGSKYYLTITSKDVIREPILSFVVELNWSSGHLLRNYALIIDPQ
ncbi:MAG: hypothetical protein GKR93_14310 [Gammaproteobacteria bacterium]|nr:hypothetical protein [Gammaproteobacteria bacterium]